MHANLCRLPVLRAAVVVVVGLTGLLATACSSSESVDTAVSETTAPATTLATSDSTPGSTPNPTSNPTSNTEVTGTDAVAGASGAGKLVALQAGDAACYVELETSGGSLTLPGSFELCGGGNADATSLIGVIVTYTTERTNILAASCQGAPDCADTEDVDLVTTITAAVPAPGSSIEQTSFGIDGLPLGLSADDLVRQIGVQPSSKSKPVLEAATGEYATTWAFDGRGVSAKLSAIAENLAPNLRALRITKPSALKTNQGIGLGATKADVMAAYGPSVNNEESDPQNIVIGSVFDGIIFSLTDNLVTEIFVGAAAE